MTFADRPGEVEADVPTAVTTARLCLTSGAGIFNTILQAITA